jgi:hypothetical protein
MECEKAMFVCEEHDHKSSVEISKSRYVAVKLSSVLECLKMGLREKQA